MNKKMYVFSASVLVLALSFLAVVFIWLVTPYKPLEINKLTPEGKSGETLVSPKQVFSGGIIQTKTDFCINTDRPIKVSRDLVGDTVIISIPPKSIEVIFPKGCAVIDGVIQLPKTRNGGTYHVLNTATVRVNPLKEVVVTWESEPFEIVAFDEAE